MHKFLDYMDKIVGNPSKELALRNIMDETIEDIKVMCPMVFKSAMYKVHCLAYGEHFDEAMAEEAVSNMKNVDGSVGGYWTMEQTNQLAKQLGITHYADFYYVMNMLHSDFANILGTDATTYAKLAKAYMYDPDGADGKVLKIYMATK